MVTIVKLCKGAGFRYVTLSRMLREHIDILANGYVVLIPQEDRSLKIMEAQRFFHDKRKEEHPTKSYRPPLNPVEKKH